MISLRCYGETKFFKQCPRYILAEKQDVPCFCWEHENQFATRQTELQMQRLQFLELEWAPLGAFLTNRAETKQEKFDRKRGRLQQLALDDQNVHTPEVQVGVAGAIQRLRKWAHINMVSIEHDLPLIIHNTLHDPKPIELQALGHLRHCYQWNDDTLMFNTTYPQLASWVWARISASNQKQLLRDRFFEEVAESAGQCLNGNMARLMNVFAAIDDEISPQDSQENVQQKVSQAVASSSSSEEAIQKVRHVIESLNDSKEIKDAWIQSINDHFN